MAKITGSKTTKAAEAESLKAARTKHRVGAGQLFIQPNAHADREAASSYRADDTAAVDFVKGPAPVEAQAAVAHVRPTGRYERRIAAPAAEQIETTEVSGWTVRTGPGFATAKQAQWMISIAGRPSVTPEMRESLRLRLEQGFARTAASAFITKYKDIPAEVTAAQAAAGYETSRSGAPLAAPVETASTKLPEVEEGRYAVEEDGVLKFFRVTKGKGRWAGRTFLEIQASDDRYAVRNRSRVHAILATIAANPLEASIRYGVELGRCYACGRTLTDATSRELGIGPDCRNK